jgi:molybdopterin molybdotransferase
VGASASVPVPLSAPLPVRPGDPLPPGTDAVLPPDGIEPGPLGPEAIRPIGPGEGARRAGHDGRAGAVFARAGQVLTAGQAMVAGMSGIATVAVRRPRVAIRLEDAGQAALAGAWMRAAGAALSDDAPDLILRGATDHRPRLALSPAETAWLSRDGAAMVLTLPRRFDGMVAACLALGLPALAAQTGAAPRSETRALSRKVTSAVGMADLVLLARDGDRWSPFPAGSVTLTALAGAVAFAILPPGSEGMPEGALLSATLLPSG